MIRNHLLSAALLIAAFTSCSQEEQFGLPNEQQKEFMGMMEKVNSRVTLDNDYMMNWEMNDQITIFPKFTINNCYKVSSIKSNGAASFAFVDFVNNNDYTTMADNYAVYPYYDNNSISEEVITSTVPDKIEYTGMEGSIKKALMVAKSNTTSLNFTNAQGILRLCLNADQPFVYGPIKTIKFTSSKNKLTGTATIDYSESDTPSAKITEEGNNEITIELAENLQKELPKATNNEYAEYYIPMVPTVFELDDKGKGYLTMEITFTNGGTYTKSVDLAFNIERRKIYKLSHKLGSGEYSGEFEDVEIIWDGETLTEVMPVTDETTGETYYPIAKGSDLAWLADAVNNGTITTSGRSGNEGLNIKLTSDIDLGGKEWTPIGFNNNEESGNENYFTGVFDGGGYTISNLKIDVTDRGGVGLFGAVHNATFKNFTLDNVDIKAVESESNPEHKSGAQGYNNYIVGGQIGAIAGYDAEDGTISFENVSVTGLIKIEGETRVAQGQRISGIIGGKGSSKYLFNNVHVTGDQGSYIKGFCSTAGILGQGQEPATFEDVTTDIDIQAVTFGAGGIAGIVRQGTTFTNCSSAGNITLDATNVDSSIKYSANYFVRIGGIAGTWSETASGELTLTNCQYTGTLSSKNKDGNSPELFDYNGFVGRGYQLTNCAGSKVTIDGTNYVQADNKTFGIYEVNGALEIGTVAALKWFANEVNTGNNYFTGKTVKLSNDINLNNEEWTPIGSASLTHGFMGNFDGNNKTIKNLNITNIIPDSDGYVYAGLFGVTEGTDKDNQINIKNLTIENVNITTDGHIVAAAIAYPYYTTIENITVKGNINIKGGNYTAGVLAYTRRCIDAKNISIEGNSSSSIEGNTTVGGVISDIQMNGGLTANYTNFKASGLEISGTQAVGGISGIISSQTLDGAIVKDIVLTGEGDVGMISGSMGGSSILKNLSIDNVSGATAVIGGNYSDNNPVEVRIGDQYYAALVGDVLAKAEVGETITLLADVTLTEDLEISEEQNLIVDLNGKSLSRTSTTPVSMITNKGVLTIKDSKTNGKIAFTFNGTVHNSKAANVISNKGTLIVESGEISNTGTENQIGYAIDNYNGSTLTIEGGTISTSGSSSYDGIRLFCGSKETTVTVNKGNISSIWAQNPSKNKATEVKGTVIINGGSVSTTYYENYTTVKVKNDVEAVVIPYGAGNNNTITTQEGDYTVYSFNHNE